MEQFLKLPADELLKKFGAGLHIPGSGSAAALNGLIAANLMYTVGQLTLKKPAYEKYHVEVADICEDICTKLIPTLTSLFQEDAEAFDVVYKARVARRDAVEEEKERLRLIGLEKQKLATAIPFKIADACAKLVDHATRLFDVGFTSARGDTGVALGTAVAGVLSAVYVINLNLIPYKGNYWAQQRRLECDRLQKTVMDTYEAAIARLDSLRAEDVDAVYDDESATPIASLLSRSKVTYTDEEIDERAKELRSIVWRNRFKISTKNGLTFEETDLMDPEIALRMLGYSFSLEESLGRTGAFEIAGLLDALAGEVKVSRQMKAEIRLFTTAHELGHIILHPQLNEAHRDRPLDGSVISRTPREKEADKFASSYLMPSIPVRDKFAAIFGTDKFVLSDVTAFALLRKGEVEARLETIDLRGLSLKLASAERYNGRQVVPLATQFKVSPTAMAIRIEELKLLQFDV